MLLLGIGSYNNIYLDNKRWFFFFNHYFIIINHLTALLHCIITYKVITRWITILWFSVIITYYIIILCNYIGRCIVFGIRTFVLLFFFFKPFFQMIPRRQQYWNTINIYFFNFVQLGRVITFWLYFSFTWILQQ